MTKWHLGWLVPLALWGCSQNYSEEKVDKALAQKGLAPIAQTATKTPLPSGHPPLIAAEGRQSLGGISAEMPEGWQQVPPSSSMRKAEYLLPGEGAEDGSLAVFYFGPSQGGGLEANIERWYGQFTQPDGGSTKAKSRRWNKEVSGMPVTLVDIQGTYNPGGMGMGTAPVAKDGYRMLGAVVESPVGAFFFKLTGPQATLERWNPAFEQYIDSMQPE